MTKNFPDDVRLKDLPDEIRMRYRGRSVPSPVPQAEVKPKQTVELMIAKTVIPLNFALEPGVRRELFVAASDWIVQAISLKASGVITAITLIAMSGEGDEVRKVIKLDNKTPVTLLDGFEKVNFIFKASEVISIESNADVYLIGSIELVQSGGKIIRTENPVSEGSPT